MESVIHLKKNTCFSSIVKNVRVRNGFSSLCYMLHVWNTAWVTNYNFCARTQLELRPGLFKSTRSPPGCVTLPMTTYIII